MIFFWAYTFLFVMGILQALDRGKHVLVLNSNGEKQTPFFSCHHPLVRSNTH